MNRSTNKSLKISEQLKWEPYDAVLALESFLLSINEGLSDQAYKLQAVKERLSKKYVCVRHGNTECFLGFNA